MSISKKERLEKAKDCFAANPKADTFYQTTDGLCFPKESAAYNHQKEVDKKKTHIKVERKELEANKERKGPAKPTVEQRIEAVQKASTLEELQELVKGESSKQVMEAAAIREGELNPKKNEDE